MALQSVLMTGQDGGKMLRMPVFGLIIKYQTFEWKLKVTLLGRLSLSRELFEVILLSHEH